MSATPPPPSPSSQPSRPITNPNTKNFRIINSHNKPPSSAVPDLVLTAVSLFFLFSSAKSHTAATNSAIQFTGIPFCPLKLNPRRRFPKIPTMSGSFPPPPPNNHHRFASPQSLSDWLKPRLPSDSFATWGVKPGTKNVHNLWLELSEGETSLADSIPPIRTVNVVTVRILGKDNRVLVESHQELSDGSVRERSRPLSEKMKPDESPEEAVARAVKEELGSSYEARILPGSSRMKMEERNSLSYPGLPARYVLHSVDAIVEGLPDDDFSTDEKEEYQNSSKYGDALNRAVSVRRHYWNWVQVLSFVSLSVYCFLSQFSALLVWLISGNRIATIISEQANVNVIVNPLRKKNLMSGDIRNDCVNCSLIGWLSMKKEKDERNHLAFAYLLTCRRAEQKGNIVGKKGPNQWQQQAS
ncbi:uncharacterized protein [Rutidosis leptorrhynchoides]|uniref:uncharacterized protein n=1 Tax=Rutidosis leptorrhynchoides TaxID=125765 RepID=UPI003A9A04ED